MAGADTMLGEQEKLVGRKRPFDDHPEFFEQDNRKHRERNPVTKGTLEAKFGVLLPAWLVKGKTVLDLGSCIGAAGQWSLFYGARSYTGVEVQNDYVAKSQIFLSSWGSRASMVKSDIRTFLSQAPSRSYDVVVGAGVLYLFIDPEAIVGQMCRVANESVVIESNYPGFVRAQSFGKKNTLITEYSYSQDVNMADGNYSLGGVAASSSPDAFDLFFKVHGFVSKEGRLKFPVSPDTVVYTDEALAVEGLLARFAARYFRTPDQKALPTLEQNLPSGAGERKSWSSNPAHKLGGKKYVETAQAITSGYKKWEFNEEVAGTFGRIARQSIPHYHEVIDKAVEIIKKQNFDNPKIIDVGSAVGTTLERLYQAGYRNLYGVDSSEHMLARSFDKATLIHSDRFPASHAPFDAVIANWVLHFVDEREKYIVDISNSLQPNGVLILSEKVQHSSMARSLYHDFERKNGLTDTDIEKKEKQLAGVLEPYPLMWYLRLLEELGFRSVEVVDAHYAFATIVAQR